MGADEKPAVEELSDLSRAMGDFCQDIDSAMATEGIGQRTRLKVINRAFEFFGRRFQQPPAAAGGEDAPI